MSNLIYSWGIVDVDYEVTSVATVNGKRKIIWRCPYYVKWSNMIKRTIVDYDAVSIWPSWKYLSTFISWVDSQPNKDWTNCELDKDIIGQYDKIYSPNTCCFVSHVTNSFINYKKRAPDNLLMGVTLHNQAGKYISQCNNPFSKKRESYLGIYETEIEAHLAWQEKKHEYACQLADLQGDERVAKALRERYAPDKDWTKV